MERPTGTHVPMRDLLYLRIILEKSRDKDVCVVSIVRSGRSFHDKVNKWCTSVVLNSTYHIVLA